MNKLSTLAALAMCISLLSACGDEQQTTARTAGNQGPAAAAPEPETPSTPSVVEIRAVGKTFQGPSEIPSGWTTFRFVNASSMIHFALLDVPPEGVTLQMMSDLLMQPFQEAMDGMNAGDEQAVNAAFAKFPSGSVSWGAMAGRAFSLLALPARPRFTSNRAITFSSVT